MQITLREVDDIKREIEVTLPPEDIEEELNTVYQKISKTAQLKGFRSGKIPRNILEQHYQQDAESEAVRNLVSQAYPEAIQECEVRPLSSPEITLTHFDPKDKLTFIASFEVRPQFEISGYEDLSLTKKNTDPSEEEINENLKGVQERMAQLIPVDEKRKPKTSDVVTLDYEAFLEGQPIPNFKAGDYIVELGKNHLFPELESEILTLFPEEKKKVGITLPATWADPSVAGKKVEIEILLKGIKEKKLAGLDDDFAKDLGFNTLEELKSKVKEDIKKAKEQAERNSLRRQVIEKLIEQNKFPVPESLINLEIEDMLRRLEGSLKAQGMTLEQAGVQPHEFSEKNRDSAFFRVQGGLLFALISEKHRITATLEEVDQRIDEMARLSGQSGAHWKKYYREHNLLPQVEGALVEEKTLDLVLSKAKIREGT